MASQFPMVYNNNYIDNPSRLESIFLLLILIQINYNSKAFKLATNIEIKKKCVLKYVIYFVYIKHNTNYNDFKECSLFAWMEIFIDDNSFTSSII